MVRPLNLKVNTNMMIHSQRWRFLHLSSGGGLRENQNEGCVKNPVKRVVSLVSRLFLFLSVNIKMANNDV